jgi:hypothetical protein
MRRRDGMASSDCSEVPWTLVNSVPLGPQGIGRSKGDTMVRRLAVERKSARAGAALRLCGGLHAHVRGKRSIAFDDVTGTITLDGDDVSRAPAQRLVERGLVLVPGRHAIFLEKGEVKSAGPTSDLVERDDIARAVFLGTGS